MPKISVIIPAYNAQKTIKETILSVLQQTLQDFELLVVDDASTDQTLDVIGTIKDSRLKVYTYKNSGVAIARNRGIQHASGEFFSFLDHDDLWTPDKLESQMSTLERFPKAGVAYSWTTYLYRIKGQTCLRSGLTTMYEGDIYAQLLLCNFIESGSNILARRQAIDSVGLFDPAPINCEDWDYYLRLAAQWHFALVPRYQILYRQSLDAMSSQIKKTEVGGMILLEKAYQIAPVDLHSQKNQSYALHYLHCAQLYLGNKIILESLRLTRLAIYQWPRILLRPALYHLLCNLILKMILPLKLVNLLSNMQKEKMSRVKL